MDKTIESHFTLVPAVIFFKSKNLKLDSIMPNKKINKAIKKLENKKKVQAYYLNLLEINH